MKHLFNVLSFKTIQHLVLIATTLCSIQQNLLLALKITNPSYLKPVNEISQAKNVTFISRFYEYEDTSAYGELPNVLNTVDLNSLNSFVNWHDPSSFKILNQKELYVAKINNAYVSPQHLGTMFDYDQQFLFNLFIDHERTIFWPLDNSIKKSSIVSIKKLATAQGPSLFYHWVVDRLPSINLLKELLVSDPEIKLLVNKKGNVPSYVYEYLDLLGISRNQIITAKPDTIYHAETLYFATPFLMEPIPRKLLLKLREDLLLAVNKSTAPIFTEKLAIIIQRKESDRRIVNLKELEKLIKETFSEQIKTVIYDANMPVKDQIQLFNRADLVIGVMASGLTNVLFVKPGTTVIEIHPSIKHPNKQGCEWCWWLSSTVNASYWATISDFELSDQSIIAPLDQIRKILLVIKKQ